jgi:hypothetical protein
MNDITDSDRIKDSSYRLLELVQLRLEYLAYLGVVIVIKAYLP